MTATMHSQPPLPMAPPAAVTVAPGVAVDIGEGGDGVVWLHGAAAWCWSGGDDAARRLAAVQLVDTGTARQRAVAAAFGVSEQSVHNWRKAAAERGVAGLVTSKPGPKGAWKVTDDIRDKIVALDRQGRSQREIARACGVSTFPVRQVLAARPDTHDTHDGDDGDGDGDEGALETLARPEARTAERAAARAGVLAGAPPQICQGRQLPHAGALLALPGLAATGLVEIFDEVYGSGRAAFYDLRALVLTIVFAALLGQPRAEGLSRIDPTDLGRLIGLDRAPVTETVRRRVGELAQQGRSDELFAGLARRHLATHPDLAGMFYLDGHVRAYHGIADLPKAHVARMRISMPATVDSWICDGRGDGVLVWTSPPGASLVGELKDAVAEIRELVGPDARPTVVFDRGGWSPKTFRQLDQDGFDILTYRKGESARESASAFADHTHVDDHGVSHTYRLADRTVRIGYNHGGRRRFQCRQITRDCGDGHHTTIVTTRTHDNPAELAHAMFSRWRQENFFRYMRSRFDLDGLDSYHTVADDHDRTVPNPDKKAAAKRTKQLKASVASGQAALDRHRRNSLPALADSVTELAEALAEVRDLLHDHHQTAKAIPARLPLGQLRDNPRLHHGEHKRLIDAIRMACYNTESSLARAVRPHYARGAHEARTLLREALAAPADLHIADGDLHVTLNPMSAPRRTRAIAALCTALNDTETVYPGTDLRLVYAIKTPADLN